MNHTDLTFITNEGENTLRDRFQILIKDSRFFDCLVAYFYISGFHNLYHSLEKTEKIRILFGINTDIKMRELISENLSSKAIKPSHVEVKEKVSQPIIEEMETSDDNEIVEEGINKFIEWLKNGKLEIRAYPSQNIHAKLYIMTFTEADRDVGRVITGSSNFTQKGLIDNLEFNVELKNRNDYEFAKEKFEELWKDGVDISETYIQTIYKNTWLNPDIKPYELYLKFLYEYFKDELKQKEDISFKHLPPDFKKFEYQEQAVLNAKRILEEYGGVFISDVVGTGKTYMGTMLAGQLDGRTIVIAPPNLLSKTNPGSWPNVFSDFRIDGEFVSIGKLDNAKTYIKRYENSPSPVKNIIIDESHRFRTEETVSYEEIAEICRGKRVILISATPYNNSPKDILSQIKLFQNVRKSTIPGQVNLEALFKEFESRLKKVNKDKNYNEYIKIAKNNAKEIREKVLKYLMVRRTRGEIEKYFAEDLKKQGMTFPKVEDPKPFFYQLNNEENRIFMKTIELVTKQFKYARYMPLLYLKKGLTSFEEQSQKNLGGFMKVLLVKRLESSFYAFRNTIERFIHSYEIFIREYKKGSVYVSKKYLNKIFELLEQDNDEAIQKLIDEGKAERYESNQFQEYLQKDLENDLEILKKIKEMWQSIQRDPKLETLIQQLKTHKILKNKKIIIFTESKETAEYLTKNINEAFGKEIVLLFHGESSENVRNKIIENFDAKSREKKDDYQILVSTEVLAEGVNLHQSNIVINYDIPWNPTKLIQRVGRINRVDTPHETIYTFNFFPTTQADTEIELTNIARSKIESFLTLLGGDSSILTEGEPVASHELFDKLISKKTLTEDEKEESELKYLRIIEEIRDKSPELFEKIKRLPKKARSAKMFPDSLRDIATPDSLITFFRKGKLMKFYLTSVVQASDFNLKSSSGVSPEQAPQARMPVLQNSVSPEQAPQARMPVLQNSVSPEQAPQARMPVLQNSVSPEQSTQAGRLCYPIETDFITTARIFESAVEEKRTSMPQKVFYELLNKNKEAFYNATMDEETIIKGRKNDNITQLMKILKITRDNSKHLPDEQKDYLNKVMAQLQEGAIPKPTVKRTLKNLESLKKDIQDPLKVIGILYQNISPELLKSHYVESSSKTQGKREVILSLYLTGVENG